MIDFVNALIEKKPKERLGAGGIQELKLHPWLLDSEWDKIERKEVRPPFVPKKGSNYYKPSVERIELKQGDQIRSIPFPGYLYVR